MTTTYAVIMAGGSGTRFWPRSRKSRPKQLLPIGSPTPLLVRTSERVAPLAPPSHQFVITSARYVDDVRAMLPDVPPAHVIGEPEGRDTAPCIGLASRVVERLDPHASVVAMPSDHLIGPEHVFVSALGAAGEALATHDAPVLVFGITPDRPTSAYGYLRPGAALGEVDGLTLSRLDAFVEKPDEARAATLIEEGCLWNAGLFAFRPSALRAAYDRHLPGMNAALDPIVGAFGTDGFDAALAAHFGSLEKISIDYGVMEKLDDSLLLPLPVKWDDVGSWTAYERLIAADESGNWLEGSAVAIEAHGNILAAGDGLVAVRGVDDLIVVHTPDATMVCKRSDAEGVKQIVAELERRGLSEYL